MSHPQPPQRQPTQDEAQAYMRAIHNTALVAVVVCPILALLPPRKFDVYTIGLVGTTAYSANYLLKESTGKSAWERLGPQKPITTVARQEQQENGTRGSVVGEMQKDLRGQREAWKVQRQKEIKDDVEEGKGFGDMIVDQIWEVWNWGKTTDDDDDDDGGKGENQKEG